MRRLLNAVCLVDLIISSGCGGSEEYRYAEEPLAPETVYANEVRTRLNEMKQANATEGPKSVDTIGFLEGMSGYVDVDAGDNQATFDEVRAGVEELQKQIASGASRQDVGAKIDALIAKAETLPKSTPKPETPPAAQ